MIVNLKENNNLLLKGRIYGNGFLGHFSKSEALQVSLDR